MTDNINHSFDFFPGSDKIKALKGDTVNSPSHYTQLNVECIDVAEHFDYCLGNVIKYVWRADFKGKPLEDLRKARWYLNREIERREKSFCASENLEPPKDYAEECAREMWGMPETIEDVVRETRHGGNMLGKKQED